MRKGLLGILAIAFSLSLSAQKETLIWIGNEEISADEFLAVYNKNKDVGKDIDPKTPNQYKDLYINFKLKVKEAQDLGKDTSAAFKREFGGYRAQLAKPYLVDKTVDKILYKEAYDRMQFEVRAKHIMIDLSADAIPADTLEAYNKLMTIRKEILKGASFEEKAKQVSSDTYSAKSGGDLGYFTVFNMVYPFENAAYTTPVGQISMPVRSQFGYHLVKVEDKRPASGQVEVKHIFLIANNNSTPEKAAEAEKKAQEIYTKLKEGTEFDLLVRQYSDDKATAEKGGLLPPFGINKMYPEFEAQAFALNTPGEYSEPFKTAIGWHIIQLSRKIPIGTYEEELPKIKTEIKGERAMKGKLSLISKLKKEYNFKESKKALKDFYGVMDDSYLKGNWDVNKAAKLKKELFELDGKSFSQKDFAQYLNDNQRKGKKSETLEQEVYKQYTNWVNKTVLDHEDANLESKYPEFKMLVNEYRDGILLFDLTEEKVWNKASKDSLGLYNYYSLNQDKYWYGERAEAAIVSCANKSLAKKVIKLYKKGKRANEILEELNNDSQLNVIIDVNTFEKGDNAMVDQFPWVQGETDFVEEDERVKFVYFLAILQPEPKPLEETRGLVISDYQKQLEKEWIDELHAKYPVKVNEELFSEITKTVD